VVAALASDTDQGRQLRELLARPDPLIEEDLVLAAKLVEEADGKHWAEAETDTQLAEAERCLAETDMPDDVHAEFSAIAQFITTRQS
jgi:geranylgeranyl diphosphate synthase type I